MARRDQYASAVGEMTEWKTFWYRFIAGLNVAPNETRDDYDAGDDRGGDCRTPLKRRRRSKRGMTVNNTVICEPDLVDATTMCRSVVVWRDGWLGEWSIGTYDGPRPRYGSTYGRLLQRENIGAWREKNRRAFARVRDLPHLKLFA